MKTFKHSSANLNTLRSYSNAEDSGADAVGNARMDEDNLVDETQPHAEV